MTDDPTASIADQQGLPSLDNVIVVLSRTTEPMNIGAACRAMKTMGLRHLRLISPLNPKGRTARSLAHGAEDVLDDALIVDDLVEAVGDAVCVTGTTARARQLRKRALLTPDALAEHIVDHSRSGKVVIMFGTERTGLTNDEVDICRYLSRVDTDPGQSSLNLAQAVMLYGWEIRQAHGLAMKRLEQAADGDPGVAPEPADVRRPEMRVRHPHRSTKLPTQYELDTMYAHLAAAMRAVGYTDQERLKFLTYLRQLHQRAGIVDWETHIYHMFCARILKTVGAEKFPGLPVTDEKDTDQES
jgi:tRNA (cytidine32/uridine32-2'-O)-methyltransferase